MANLIRPMRREARVGLIKPGAGERPYTPPDLPEETEGPEKLNLVPKDQQALAQRIGSDRASDVFDLRREGVVGTAPELVVYDWLQRRDREFYFQTSLMGGMRVAGGAQVDFIVPLDSGWAAWRVQGEHWHGSRSRQARDAIQRRRLLRAYWQGVPITEVIDLWEFDLYENPEAVIRLALQGMEFRRF